MLMDMSGMMLLSTRQTFLRRLCALGFLNKNNAPTPEAADSVPRDLDCPFDDRISKTIVFFHDESAFQSNDDQTKFWGTRDMKFLRPKSKGAGIMVSDFINGQNGYLQLTEEEFSRAKETLKRHARAYLEYGENKEGYWTSERFMTQIKDAVMIAECKYPRDQGYRLVWIFLPQQLPWCLCGKYSTCI